MDGTTRVLVVDDDTNVLALVSALLGHRHDLRIARNGRDALRLARTEPPDLVLLDIEMPGMDGYEVCRRLKADPLLGEVPVVFLTAHGDEQAEVRGLSAGAADFIAKPPRGPAVAARVANLVRMKRMADRLRAEAMTDGLTGVANRAHFDHMLRQEWLRAMRNAHPLALLMVDVDHFKAFNDRYGHLAGDGCLRSVAQTLCSVAQALRSVAHRPADLLARYGGEEFVLLLPDTDGAGARRMASLLHGAMVAADLPHQASSVSRQVTVSIGCTAIDADSAGWAPWSVDSTFMPATPPLTPQDLVMAADQALYAAKSHGRAQAWFLDIAHAQDRAMAQPCHEHGRRARQSDDTAG